MDIYEPTFFVLMCADEWWCVKSPTQCKGNKECNPIWTNSSKESFPIPIRAVFENCHPPLRGHRIPQNVFWIVVCVIGVRIPWEANYKRFRVDLRVLGNCLAECWVGQLQQMHFGFRKLSVALLRSRREENDPSNI